MTTMIYETSDYQVDLLVEPIPVEQNGATLFFNYGVFNKNTGRTESYAQFEPSAMELVNNLTLALDELRTEDTLAENTDDSVVRLN